MCMWSARYCSVQKNIPLYAYMYERFWMPADFVLRRDARARVMYNFSIVIYWKFYNDNCEILSWECLFLDISDRAAKRLYFTCGAVNKHWNLYIYIFFIISSLHSTRSGSLLYNTLNYFFKRLFLELRNVEIRILLIVYRSRNAILLFRYNYRS